jgi:hypothetical protein
MRIWPFRKRPAPPEPLEVWPDYIDRLFRAVGAVIEAAEGAFTNTWEFETPVSHDAEDLFGELKAAYEDVLLIDTRHKASAAAARLLAAYGSHFHVPPRVGLLESRGEKPPPSTLRPPPPPMMRSWPPRPVEPPDLP